ncbi:MAG: YdcF family protein [Candidatus Acidiferrales bacterium]
MKTSDDLRARSKTFRRRRVAVAMLLFALAVLCLVSAFREAGVWLVREDTLAPADVIFVLSGSMPYRAEEAAKIYRRGYAPEVWVSRPLGPAENFQQLGIRYIGEEEYNREVLIHEGVPESAIRILPDEIVDTEQEMEAASNEMRITGKRRIIIVTSPEHTRRVRALWRKLGLKNSMAIVRAASEDPFDAFHWWRNTRDALAVVREYLGLLNVSAGLPVRPHSGESE